MLLNFLRNLCVFEVYGEHGNLYYIEMGVRILFGIPLSQRMQFVTIAVSIFLSRIATGDKSVAA